MLVSKITLLVVCVAAATSAACGGSTSAGVTGGQAGSCRKWTIQYADATHIPPKQTGEACTSFGAPCSVSTTHYNAYLNDPFLAYERVCTS
jgi:hypothetical protein